MYGLAAIAKINEELYQKAKKKKAEEAEQKDEYN